MASEVTPAFEVLALGAAVVFVLLAAGPPAAPPAAPPPAAPPGVVLLAAGPGAGACTASPLIRVGAMIVVIVVANSVEGTAELSSPLQQSVDEASLLLAPAAVTKVEYAVLSFMQHCAMALAALMKD